VPSVTAISFAQADLVGRTAELGVLFDIVDRLRERDGGRTLVVRGEPGIGKTSLLTTARHHASNSGVQVLSTAGAQSEADLPFSGLHQLLLPLLAGSGPLPDQRGAPDGAPRVSCSILDRLEHLPERQRDALGCAFGLSADAAPDRFFVGLAVLTLLSKEADDRPLFCAVDDAQWLDQPSAQILAFVARRLSAESVALVFAASEPSDELRGLPELMVEGLRDADALELLRSVVPGRLDERVRQRIIAETRGNPLALLELPRGVSTAQLGGGFGLSTVMSDAMSLPCRIAESFVRRLEALPADTRLLLLVAATEPVGDPALLWRAAERLGIASEALAPAAAAELLEVGVRVRFRHPLVRSAVYRTASLAERQNAHRALADVTDPDVDPDRRAWHRAEAAAGPDEEVALELERSAARAQVRGGLAAAAAFLERAVGLTVDPALRTRRALLAARAKFEAAAPDAAFELLATAEMGPLDELQRARLERLRVQITFALERGTDAPALLLDTAKRLEPLDAELARETYLEALTASIFAGRECPSRGVMEVAGAARAAPAGPRSRPVDLLLDALATRFTEPYVAALPSLTRALHALAGRDGGDEDDLRWLWFACPVTPEPLAPELWDDEIWHQLAIRAVGLARDAGALSVLPVALTYRACVHVYAGEFAAASALIEEADAITAATGNAPLRYTSLALVAWRGRETAALNVIETDIRDATARGEGRAVGFAKYVTAVLHNGHGRYREALEAAHDACAHDDLGICGWALTELVESAARSDRRDIASDALYRLEERTRASGTDWALGIEARSRALLSEGDAAERLYREAIERLSSTRIRVELARARLHYGEWLRRERRRVDAREQLRGAYDAFASMGAEAFADRSRRELTATCEKVRKRRDETRDELTPQEEQIARLARDGLTNPEIAAQLFVSPRTVEYHLRKVFTKLEITSRLSLHEALPGAGLEPEAA
jgi:DNA-binding CsgD family transcriptional regulator/tetratricopeptide (TPR) repeat protein